MKSKIIVILAAVILSGTNLFAQADSSKRRAVPDPSNVPTLFSIAGCEKFEGKKYPFPINLETSSLTYDPSDSSFYTTIDKGSPHIVHFRIENDRIRIIRQDNIIGLTSNFDFEGIEIAGDETGRHLFISTEKFTSFDTLTCFSVDWETWEFEQDNVFKLKLNGAGPNNNLEGIAFNPRLRLFYLAKERQPYALYTYSKSAGQKLLFDETEFYQALTAYIDSVSPGCLNPRRKESLKLVSLSGLDFDQSTGHLFALNRYGRSVLELEISPFPGNKFNIVAIYAFRGVDFDRFDRKEVQGIEHFGMAEGLAILGSGPNRKLALITDPGPGSQSHLFIFPFPGPESEY